jgi:hypothetical protein
MTNQYYTETKNDDEDLSGFLTSQPYKTKQSINPQEVSKDDEDLSGFLTSQPYKTKQTSKNDQDLSGFLTSQRRAIPKSINSSPVISRSNDDEDLSGCLTSGFLKPRKTVSTTTIANPAPIQPAKVEEIEIDNGPSSEWFYGN